jgi:ATP:corrinoid adenosyltransferase
LNGRINYKQNEEELYKDFNLRAIPPKEMVSYDELSIPWDAIRLMIPDVIDVFASPNNEFIVAITSSHMIIYYVENGDIINEPVAKIKLPYDSSVIMSEWAVGRYTNLWENEVVENGGTQLDY